MGRIYQRGGRLWLDYRDASGRRVRRSSGFTTAQTRRARRLLRDLEGDRVGKRWRGGEPVPTLGEFLRGWLARREREGKHVESDRSRLENHVIPALGDIVLTELRPDDVRQLVAKLKSEPSSTGHRLAPRTISQVVRRLRVAVTDAMIAEIIPLDRTNPVLLRPGDLPTLADADPTFRARALFTRAEMRALISDAVAPAARLAFAILFLTGCRVGELAALRWADLEPAEPLWRLLISRSWSTSAHVEKGTKTGIQRQVPVHARLLPRLLEWRDRGWALEYGRAPRLTNSSDLILPAGPAEVHFDAKSFGQARKNVLRQLGLRPRRTHDTRRTFISIGLDDGAEERVLRRVTHVRPAEVYDLYRQIPWVRFCEAVSKLQVAE